MVAKIIDGKAIAAQIQEELKAEVGLLPDKPCLAVILVGDNQASHIYVRKKRQACEAAGIKSQLITDVNNCYAMLDRIDDLNNDRTVHGILVQLPLPKPEWDEENLFDVFSAISPLKDVDVFNPHNVGLLVQGRPLFTPCTPQGIQLMLNRSGLSVKGKHSVVISRSDIIGKPLSSMLIQDNDEFANATVTVCHDDTPPDLLSRMTRSADIVIVAVGIPHFLKAGQVSPGAIIVDVGTNKVDGKIVGDVHPGVWDVAGHISPAIGGVGPMTIVCLLKNTIQAAKYAYEQ